MRNRFALSTLCVALLLAGCEDESYSSDVALHAAQDAVRLPRRFTDIRPGGAENCGLEDVGETTVEHCLFRFGPVSEQPMIAAILTDVAPADRPTVAAQLGEYARTFEDWIIVRSRARSEGALYRYSLIQRDRLLAATSFAEARYSVISARVTRLTLGRIGGDLSSGGAEWRSDPDHLVFRRRGVLEGQMALDVMEFYDLRDIDDQDARCAAARESALGMDVETQFGCLSESEDSAR